MSRSWGLFDQNLLPMLFGEAGEGQHVAGGVGQQLGGSGEPLGELLDNAGMLRPHRLGVGLSEDGPLYRDTRSFLRPSHRAAP